MQQRLIELQVQRGRLLERIANQRRDLAQASTPVGHALHVGDRLTGLIERGKRFSLAHPVAVGAAVVVLVVLRPAGVLRWSRRGFMFWRTWTTLRAAFPAVLTRRL